jgi:hypothetical protein
MHILDTITGQGTANQMILLQFHINLVCHVGPHTTSIICTALYCTLLKVFVMVA